MLTFEEKYLNAFNIIQKCAGLNKLQPLQLFQSAASKSLAYIAPNLDNVSQVANSMKILVESTYKILQENINENY